MPYCPTCKKEYPLGTTICVDCNVALVDSKAVDMISLVTVKTQDIAEDAVAFLTEQGVNATFEYSLREDNYHILVGKADRMKAMKQYFAYTKSIGKGRDSSQDASAPPIKIVKVERREPEPSAAESEESKDESKSRSKRSDSASKEESKSKKNDSKSPASAEAKTPAASSAASAAKVDEPEQDDDDDINEYVDPIQAKIAAAKRLVAASLREETRKAAAPVITEEASYESDMPSFSEPAYLDSDEPADTAVEEAVSETVEEAVETVVEDAPFDAERELAYEVNDSEDASEEAEEAAEEVSGEDSSSADEPAYEEASDDSDESDDEEESDEDDSDDETEEDDADDEDADDNVVEVSEDEDVVFTANAATRTRRPVMPKLTDDKEESASDEPSDMFEARKQPKRRPSLFEEMEKDEAAAENVESDEDSTIDFTPKRPLTTYQFEKKRQEDLASYAKTHDAPVLDSRKPEAIAEAEGDEEDANTVKFAFSNYEQQYVVPDYEESEPTPVYQSNSSNIDWSQGAEDISIDITTEESEGTEEAAEDVEAAETEVTAEEAVAETVKDAEAEEPAEEVSEPIFVEVERVEHEDLDEDSIIDEADVHTYSSAVAEETEAAEEPEDDSYVSPVSSATDPLDYEGGSSFGEGASNDAFSDFLDNFKKATLSKTRKKAEAAAPNPESTIASVTVKPVAVPEQVKTASKKPALADAPKPAPVKEEVPETPVTVEETVVNNDPVFEMPKTEEAPDTVIEDIVPDAKYQNEEVADFESVPSRPTDIQDTKIKVSVDSDIIEEVITGSQSEDAHPDIAQSSSFANGTPDEAFDAKTESAPKRFDIPDEEFDPDRTYRGFVPDYSPTSVNENEEPVEESEYDEFKKKVHARKEENAAINAQIKKEQVRQASLVKDFGKKGKIVFEDTDDLDNYAGFVPDYTPNTNNEEEFDFYKPHQVSSYAKYKKNSKAAEPAAVLSYMRQTNAEESVVLFEEHVPSFAKRELAPEELKNATFLVCMGAKRLAKLFNSWMMLNITQNTVKAFESETASEAQNYQNKIAGIKKLLTDNFGELNEVFLDSLVTRYYSKFLDE
ncbi:MAG: hypothetical protein IKX54_03120 [Lachnospiraceae bacterium]|nr:hypothetical protein [Lachnospiraceae bacterium]